MASILTITNQKGGCGKTTLAMGLAGTLAIRGYKVLVIDADLQATATRWACAAADDAPFPAAITGLATAGAKLHREIRKYVGNYDYIIVDTPPAVDSAAAQSALLVSDLALVPVIPSPADLWSAQGILHVIEKAQVINEALKSLLVPNMVPHTVLGRDALEALNEFGIPVACAGLGQRTAFREAAVQGGPVHALGQRARRATEEIEALCDEVLLALQ